MGLMNSMIGSNIWNISWSHPNEKRIDHYQVDIQGCPTRSVKDLNIMLSLCTDNLNLTVAVVAVDICNETSQPAEAMLMITSMLVTSSSNS